MIDVFAVVANFNREICGLPDPPLPKRLDGDRKRWTVSALREELQEFEDATNIVDEVDALIDLIVFASGRMQEMGVDGSRAFAEVMTANMRKKRGELSKRPGSKGHDAIKPPGWRPPDYSWLRAGPRVSDTVRRISDGLSGIIVDIIHGTTFVVNTEEGYVFMELNQLEVVK